MMMISEMHEKNCECDHCKGLLIKTDSQKPKHCFHAMAEGEYKCCDCDQEIYVERT